MTEKLGVTEKEPAFGQKTPGRTGRWDLLTLKFDRVT